jgi:hypothetical protein
MKLNGTAEQLRARLAGGDPVTVRDAEKELVNIEAGLEAIRSELTDAKVRAQAKHDAQLRERLKADAAAVVRATVDFGPLEADIARLAAQLATIRAQLDSGIDAADARLMRWRKSNRPLTCSCRSVTRKQG